MAYPALIASSTLVQLTSPTLTQRHVDYTQNGVWWTVLGGPSGNAPLKFYYSTDDGNTWNYVSGMDLTDPYMGGATGNYGIAMFIDKDDFMHVVVSGAYSSNNMTHYYRGVPNAGRTSYTLTHVHGSYDIVSNSSAGMGLSHDIVVFRDATSGWHVWFTSGYWDSVWFYPRVMHITLNSSGVPTAIQHFFPSTGYASTTGQWWCSIDFRHTATDPKLVQAATPHIYCSFVENSGAAGMYFNKGIYSGGSWSFPGGAERWIDSSQSGYATGLVYDGTRIIMLGNPDGSSQLSVYERDEADTSTTLRSPPSASDGDIRAAGLLVDRNGNIYVAQAGSTSQDVKTNRYNRATNSWAGWQTLRTGAITYEGMTGGRYEGPDYVLPVIYRDTATSQLLFDVLAVTKPVTESGVASDTAIRGPIASDSGVSTESITGRVFGTQDGAQALDSSSVASSGGVYNEAEPYNGIGTYNFPDAVYVNASDNGDSFDYIPTLNASIPRSDTGVAVDTSVLSVQKVASDSGVATDAGVLIKETRFVTDAGGGSEFAALGTGRFTGDSGIASDTSALYPGLLAAFDVGTAVDAITDRALGLVDAAIATDATVRSVDRTDSGVATDTAQQAIVRPVTDSGVATDSRTGAILIGATVSDSGVATDAVTGRAYTGFIVSDSAVAVDRAWQWGPIILVPVMQRFGEFGVAQQSGYGVPAAMASYSMPLGMPEGSGVPEPVVNWTTHYPARGAVALQEVRRELVPWLADFTIPAFIRPMPLLIQGLLSTDTVAGNLHTLTPGTNDIWFTFYSRRPGLAYERYTDGLIEGLRFDFSSGEPLQVGVQAQGREPEFLASAFTTNVLEDIRAGWLTYIGATVKFDWAASPATTLRAECESGSLYLSRPLTVHGNYRGMKSVGISRGNLAIELTIQLTFQNIDHYRYSVYGGLTTVPQGTTVYGSAEITFFEWKLVGGTRYMKVTLPAVQWDVAPPQPLAHPEQGHILVDAVGQAIVPASIGRSGNAITMAVNT